MDFFPDLSDIQPDIVVKKTIKNKPKLNARLVRRLLAFGIDSLFLALVGILLSIPFSGVFFSLGYNGWWIGLLISFAYYSVSATSKFKGQSLGARFLKIATVSTAGNYLNLKSSLLRNILFVVIFYTSIISGYIPSNLAFQSIYGVLFFSYISAFIVYILFNSKHRGLHDIAAGSMVVNKEVFDALKPKEKRELSKTLVNNRKAFKISAAIIALLIIGSVILAIINPFKNLLTEFSNISTLVEKQTSLQTTSVVLNTYFGPDGKNTKIIVVTVEVNRDDFKNADKLKALDAQIKKIAVNNYSDIKQIDEVKVVFNSGYSIGIWSFNENISEDSTAIQDIK